MQQNFDFMKRILFFLLLLIPTFVRAGEYTPADVPSPKKAGQDYYVSNPDAILSDTTVIWLNQCAASLEQKTEVEMCVVALESTADADAFEFSYELFQRWGIGKKGKNTGVLILFVLNSHDLQIRTGTGIEGVLTDARCSEIMHDEMFPAFKAGDYDAGLCLGALAIYETCTNGDAPEELLTIRSVTNRGKYAELEEQDDEGWIDKIAFWLALLVGLWMVIRTLIPKPQICPKCHLKKAKVTRRKTLLAASYASTGLEELTCKCKACGYNFAKQVVTPKLTHSSGGSSSGGSWGGSSSGSWGGGSTSGGGAGGKW